MKKLLSTVAMLALCAGFLLYNLRYTPVVTEPDIPTLPTAPRGQVIYANPTPSLQAAWESLAAQYTRQTGIRVRIVPQALLGDTVPTMFTVSSQQELDNCADICLELAGTNSTHHLRDWSLALYAGNKMCALPAQIDGLGLIYNAELLRTIGKTGADIHSFAKLTEAVQIIEATSAAKFAPFACANLHGEEMNLLASMPGDIRAFWDLYAGHTSCDAVTYPGSDPHQDILSGGAAFCIGSTSEFGMYAQMSEDNLNILPLYIGMDGEANQGLCVRVHNYWCIRNDIDQADIDATLDFLDYLLHPQDGKVPVDTLEICTPYVSASYASTPLEQTLRSHLAAGKKLVVLHQPRAPEGFAEALAAYTADPTDENWAAVTALLT